MSDFKRIYSFFFFLVIVVKELIQPIVILDINDESPVFTNIPTPFLAAVSLTAPAGTIVYSLTASDPDAGAQLSISLTSAPGKLKIFHMSVD